MFPMTIKKRLFISNILMIIIPIILALVTLFVAYLVLNMMLHGSLNAIFQDTEAERDVQFGQSWDAIRSQIITVGVICVVGLVAVIYFTNRFLIKFVFRKIENPLGTLTQGVRQIKSGNLDYRILYPVQDEFQPICEDFNEMAVRLKNSVDEILKDEQSRKELIAGISHDLRSPLTSIKAYVEGLIDGVAVTDETRREYLQIIMTKTDDINNMVSQLFLFSKMDTGNFPVNPEQLDLVKEITDFVNFTQDDYQARGLSVSLGGMPEEMPVYADPTHLRSVFTNILDNSAKYKDKEPAEVIINCTVKDGAALIYFDDNGPGVLPETLPKLFDVFYRGDVSRNNPRQGSGLGLAIAAKMISFIGGGISAENLDGAGLRIIINIPLSPDEVDE